ncbi:hypothetical protein ACHWQZ_G005290 [Mnemiopsis leidyi]
MFQFGSSLPHTQILLMLLTLPRVDSVASHGCYLHYAAIETVPFLRFKLPPGNQCWDYCKHLDTCNIFSFQLDDLSYCSLYKEQLGDILYDLDMYSSAIIGWKGCLLGHAAKSILGNSERWSSVEDQVVVMQKLETGFCVKVNYSESIRSRWNNEKLYPLSWTSLCDDTLKLNWELTTLITTDTEKNINLAGCKLAIFRLEDTFFCLTTYLNLKTEVTAPKAFIKRCSDEALNEKSDMELKEGAENQLLLLCPETSQNAWSVMLYRTYNPNYRPITLVADDKDKDPRHTLLNISLTDFQNLAPSTAVSACEDVKAENGSVEMAEGVPLLLPGEKITVRCEEGFGVSIDHVIRQEYETSCSEDMMLDLCTPVHLINLKTPISDLELKLCPSRSDHIINELSLITNLIIFLLSISIFIHDYL